MPNTTSAKTAQIDANEAVAHVAHRLSEQIVIYPITPASPMGELADDWSMQARTNLWNCVPNVTQMQSEGGAIAAVHGALQTGSLACTFTASQGLLLMLPNLYKIAGELHSFVLHVAARTIATHALSIFGDHSDVMSARQCGLAMLASASVQEAHDLAIVSHLATLRGRLPVLHFFDGFRTSHEVNAVHLVHDSTLAELFPDDLIQSMRERALLPSRPAIRGTAANPDTFFQAREAANSFYLAFPHIVQQAMIDLAAHTGRHYNLFDYAGPDDATDLIVIMGSGARTAELTSRALNAQGRKTGVLTVRLFRPWSLRAFINALPATTQRIAVLDRTKEPGAPAEPLCLDVQSSLLQAQARGLRPGAASIRVVGGRYGLSSKEFTPAMVRAVYDNLAAESPKDGFTVGIIDDVTHLSLPVDAAWDIDPRENVRAVFYGLGADGTVGANKNTIKILGEQDGLHAQGYFVYDSKKSGSVTISHLRFGPRPIDLPFLISQASFVACHQFGFLERFDVLACAQQNATFLLNAPYPCDQVWNELPQSVQQTILDKQLNVYTIDAGAVAAAQGLGRRINTIMQTCFFAISGVLPRELAIEEIKKSIAKTYGRRGDEIVRRNWAAVDATVAALHQLTVPSAVTSRKTVQPPVPDDAPAFVRSITAAMLAGVGDALPVSAFPPDGTWPLATTQYEKRAIAEQIPIWDPAVCIQCNKCVFVCPHAAIRAKVYDPQCLNGHAPAPVPEGFLSIDYKAPDFKGSRYTLQVAPEDCTGCGLCVAVCPAKNKSNASRKAINMSDLLDHRQTEKQHYDFFLKLPETPATSLSRLDAKASQFLLPLFEYSGACAGCGETPYIKLLTQLFGSRAVIANATGCSSIYGGNLPTTPYCTNRDGHGPAWSNSLFEDNAEYGLGMAASLVGQRAHAERLLTGLASDLGQQLVDALLHADQRSSTGLADQRERIDLLKTRLSALQRPEAARLLNLAEHLLRKSIWIVGGDGWAYDIGYGGLDHVLSMQHDVNILVLDTEVYSNTGGQASKSTPIGAAAKFAAAGKGTHKKDLGLMAMSYGHVYVASVAFGANDNQTVRAFAEAENYDGPSLIIAYSHCIAHGYDLRFGVEQQKLAAGCGLWPLYRYDPRVGTTGRQPLQLDTPPLKSSVTEYMRNEARFLMIERQNPERFKQLGRRAVDHTTQRIAMYQQLAQIHFPADLKAAPQPGPEATNTTPPTTTTNNQ